MGTFKTSSPLGRHTGQSIWEANKNLKMKLALFFLSKSPNVRTLPGTFFPNFSRIQGVFNVVFYLLLALFLRVKISKIYTKIRLIMASPFSVAVKGYTHCLLGYPGVKKRTRKDSIRPGKTAKRPRNLAKRSLKCSLL